MNVASFTLVANTGLVALTGRYTIRSISYTNGAAGALSWYDRSSTATTQSNASYDNRTLTNPYSRTTSSTDLAGNAETNTYTGVADVAHTVAADPTYAIPVLGSLATPAAGTVSADLKTVTTLGLMLKSTVNATAIVEYEPAA